MQHRHPNRDQGMVDASSLYLRQIKAGSQCFALAILSLATCHGKWHAAIFARKHDADGVQILPCSCKHPALQCMCMSPAVCHHRALEAIIPLIRLLPAVKFVQDPSDCRHSHCASCNNAHNGSSCMQQCMFYLMRLAQVAAMCCCQMAVQASIDLRCRLSA